MKISRYRRTEVLKNPPDIAESLSPFLVWKRTLWGYATTTREGSGPQCMFSQVLGTTTSLISCTEHVHRFYLYGTRVWTSSSATTCLFSPCCYPETGKLNAVPEMPTVYLVRPSLSPEPSPRLPPPCLHPSTCKSLPGRLIKCLPHLCP